MPGMLRSSVATVTLLALALAGLGGCKASIGEQQGGGDASDMPQLDASDDEDAGRDAPLDSAPDALRACTGGAQSAASPTTCFYRVDTVLPFTSAATQCALTAGATLAVIKNLADQTAAAGLVLTGAAWIGLTDQATEGVYLWPNETVNATPTFWSAGEPNDQGDGPAGEKENCGVIVQARLGLWDDRPCAGLQGQFPFVCSYPLY